jgi:hypothetical protein
MCLFSFALCFFCLVAGCFAYDIKPYTQQASGKSGGSLNLVFCSLHYKDAADFARDRETLIRRLKITKPFDEYNNFEFWYINLSQKEECKVFKPTSVFPPFKVRKDFLADISAKLKGVYKLIIIDAEGPVSCAELSSIDKLSLIIIGKNRYKDKDSFAKGFLHELGHSLGLRDEYAGCGELCPPGPPNCAAAKKEAQEWWGDLVGKDSRVNYFSGCCGKKDYIRPTVASLMNEPDKAEDFGPVNERYLRDVLAGTKK